MLKIKNILLLALPLVVAQLAQASMGFIDTILMGMLGVEMLAGGGLGAAIFSFCFIVCTGVLVASSNIIAYAVGKDDHGEIHQALLSSMVIAVALAVLCGVGLWHVGGLLGYVGQSESSIENAEIYLRSVVWALLPGLGFMALRNFALGMGRTGSILKITLAAAICNFPISYALMKGLWILPELGLRGIGYGTVIVSFLMFFAFVWDIYRLPALKPYPFWSGWGLFKLHSVLATLRLGIPMAIAYAMEAGLFTAAAILVGIIGEIELAAHQIALQCITLSFMIPVGLSQAVSVLVGRSYGANKLDDVGGYAATGVLVGFVGSSIAAFVFWFFPEVIVNLFTQAKDTQEIASVQQVGIQLLWVAALFQLVDGVQVITMGSLRGMKLALAPTLITILGYWGIGFPSAYFLMDYWGVQGVWGGLGIGLGVTAIMLVALFIYHLNNLKKRQALVLS
ncbi:MATE family efflux transporter [Alkalimarinus alittae]|uniref:Multidrug-efflux transporter n=1 Tax=Alkalimarinus alittae TaxID=2961619 RepID=A0ABY6N523_9ALTE|nr:MATE family efflux transporter [Alkalimarinus alittae]UZE97110.1 MATE family efflux transporter [Alkalimarinus alittae]